MSNRAVPRGEWVVVLEFHHSLGNTLTVKGTDGSTLASISLGMEDATGKVRRLASALDELVMERKP